MSNLWGDCQSSPQQSAMQPDLPSTKIAKASAVHYHLLMKHSPLVLTILLLLCASAHAQTISPDDGTVKDGVYYNSYFNLSFTYPKDWVVYDKAVNDRIQQRTIEEAAKAGNPVQQKDIYSLLAVTRHPRGTPGIPVNPAVFVAAERVPGNPNGKEYLLDLRSVRQKTGRPPLLDKPVEFRVAGLQFFRDDYGYDVNTVSVRNSLFVHVEKGYALIFSFTAGDQKTVEEMAKSMETILPWGRGGNRP